YENMVAHFDPRNPARKTVDGAGHAQEESPQAAAMILKGEALRARHLGKPLSELGKNAGLWLLTHADADGDGMMGWGHPLPAATAMDGLMDCLSADASLTRQDRQYIQTLLVRVARAHNPKLRQHPVDAPMAYLAGQIQRLSRQ